MDKLLKSPNSPNSSVEVGPVLPALALASIVELIYPRIVNTVLSRAPIIVISKTTKPLLV